VKTSLELIRCGCIGYSSV